MLDEKLLVEGVLVYFFVDVFTKLEVLFLCI